MLSASKKIFIKTYGCAQNTADSERVKAYYWRLGYKNCEKWENANLIVINSCIIRESAENRVYGFLNKIKKHNQKHENKINVVVTGCLVGLADKDKSGRKMRRLEESFPEVSQFLPIEKISFDMEPLRSKDKAALIPISSGCNNFCSYCIVPFARGQEVSRPFNEVLAEAKKALESGFGEVVLIGQNVNSYGSDLVGQGSFKLPNGKVVKGVIIKAMGKARIRSLFPHLLESVAKLGFDKVSFVSSNPWDFSDELIKVIANNENVDRLIHLPLQSGDDEILKLMNRGYTAKEYLSLVERLKENIEGVKISTDIIIGFPGESNERFQNTVSVCKKVGFEIAYLNKYSPREGTMSAKLFKNDIPQSVKRRRWQILEELINEKN
ncbi:MAG: MiaB/RimO family radical SAM methylthiotransferase [Patescibacteria group bacterium]|jgi:tRNA-2-methylthio-N6-dimethylallyladenosine synthase